MRKPISKPEIIDEQALAMFGILVKELRKAKALNERTMMLVDNMVMLEQLKQQHLADIKKRGAVELFEQGSQSIYRQNPSVAAVVKIVEQQRKLQAELKLTPASDKIVTAKVVTKDEFEDY